jgi:photosystem II stability/assembly factor-like uncharacterized protein
MGRNALRRLAMGCLAAAFFFGGAGAVRGEEPWRTLGPLGTVGNEGLGGRVISLAVDPRNPNRVFAGSASGGLWVSELSDSRAGSGTAADANPQAANWRDASRPYWRWRYVDTKFPVLGVGAIAIDPADPDVIYIGTGEVYGYQRTTARGFDNQTSRGNYGIGILRSTDGGRTWSKSLDRRPSQQTGVQSLQIVPDATDPDRFTVWAATSEGVLRLDASKGSAETTADWKLSLGVVAATSVSVNPRKPLEIVAACGNFASKGNGLYKTKDGGATWTRLVHGLPVSYAGKAELARSVSNPETLYVSIGNMTQLLFANNKVDPGADENGGADGITYPENKRFKCLYTPTPLVEPSSYLLRSVDGGESWETRSTTRDGGYSQGWYANTVAVHPQEPDELFIGYVGPYRSFDGGKTMEGFVVWKENRLVAQAVYSQSTDSLIFVDFHAIVYAPGRPDIVYFACDHGVYRSADGGRTIERVNQGFNTLQFYRGVSTSQKNRDFIAGVPQDYGVGFLSYTGDPSTWKIVSGWGQEAGFSAFDEDKGIGYFTTHSNRQLGRWQMNACDTTKDPNCKPQTIDPASAFDPCYIPDLNPLQRSANCLDNTSWNAPLVLAPSNHNRLYAVRDVVYRSDKAPEHTWSPLSDAEKGIPEKSCTSNAAPGVSWAPTSLGRELDGNPIFSLAVAPKDENHLVIATAPRYNRMNVFRSRDAGRNWERITYDLPETGYPMSIVFDPHSADGSIVYLTLGGFGFSHLWKLDMAEGAPRKWQDLDGGRLPDVWAAGLVIDPADKDSKHLYVATDRGVYRTADGGAKWEPWSEGLYPGVMSMDLQLYAPDRLLRLVTHGNGLWQRPLPAP